MHVNSAALGCATKLFFQDTSTDTVDVHDFTTLQRLDNDKMALFDGKYQVWQLHPSLIWIIVLNSYIPSELLYY